MEQCQAYEDDPYRRELEVTVLGAGEAAAGAPAAFFAEVDATILFPGGGGQPADHGRLGGQPVVASEALNEGRTRLYLAAAIAGPGKKLLELDWSLRYDLMQQHTAQHLLSAIAEDRFGWRTTSFHLSDELTDIELDAAELAPAQLEELEAAVAAAIRAALPVRARRVEQEEYQALPKVRSRGLPAGHQGKIRLVEIEGIDLATCGGTHLRSTAEIEMLKLLHQEPMRGGTRLYWVAGGRVRSRLAAAEARNSRLRRLLDTGDQELVSVLEGKLEQLTELRKSKERLAAKLAEAEAGRLGEQPFAERHFEDGDLPFLQKLAKSWQEGQAPGLLFLTAGKNQEGAFLLATRGAASLDLKTIGGEVAPLLEGKGGGAGRLYQGKATSFERREEAVARLASLG